jgi:hypothetical protein
MNTTLSLLGAAMLVLIGVAVVLAVVIVILHEACWIVRLGKELTRSTADADRPSVDAVPVHGHKGGD